jgi:hypothetical protein
MLKKVYQASKSSMMYIEVESSEAAQINAPFPPGKMLFVQKQNVFKLIMPCMENFDKYFITLYSTALLN